MSHLNIEIKAKCSSKDKVRDFLISKNAKFIGVDNQTDTYFNCQNGRLKLREGNVENCLVQYEREDTAEAKPSHVNLFMLVPKSPLKDILVNSLGILVVVPKIREIYFIDNVKFHIDYVDGLGDFLEIEAIGEQKDFINLQLQCEYYMKYLNVNTEDLITCSYSDLILAL
jgi:predicted adenylyl cyclase CyaB